MASCGTPTLSPGWKSAPPRKHRGSKACAMLRLSLAGLLAGCTLKFGSLPRTDHLDSLTVGISNKADVLLALGEPRGNGVARLSTVLAPRTIWFYEYFESPLTGSIDLKILVVFFDQDKYDGHFWFSSVQEPNYVIR